MAFLIIKDKTNLEVSSDTINEELPALLSCILKTGSFHFVPDTVDDLLNFIIREEIGNLTSGKHVVHQDKESFISNLIKNKQII